MKFVADGMLGKLTRWLRILGHDVKYSTNLEDAQLIQVSKKEGRVLLTRDLELCRQATAKGIEAFYLEGRTGEQKLAELSKRFSIDLDVDMTASRCPKCNTKVKPIPKEQTANRVEEKPLLTTISSGNARNASRFIGREHIGQKYGKLLKEQRRV